MQYIEVEKDLVPYQFDIVLGGKTFAFAIKYNTKYGFFVVDLYRAGRPVVMGEKLVYGRPLFVFNRYADIPDFDILPFGGEKYSEVTWDNLNNGVYLWLVSRDV